MAAPLVAVRRNSQEKCMYEIIGWLGFMWAVLFFAHLVLGWAAEPRKPEVWTTQEILEREGWDAEDAESGR
jgi:hypothetical protein